MPTLSTNLFDFYHSGDYVTVTWKGTLRQVGFTLYDQAKSAMVLKGFNAFNKLDYVFNYIVELWRKAEEAIIASNLPLTTQTVQSIFSGTIPPTKDETVLTSRWSDDHEELSYD
jgi:hypothetical protein